MLTGQKTKSFWEVKSQTEVIWNKKTIKAEEEYLPSNEIVGHPAYVSVTAGVTKNLFDYNSAKISISITYPCDPKEVDTVYPKLKDWVDKRVGSELAEIQAYLDSKSAKVEI